ETNRRREVQAEYNEEHGIVPRSIRKSIDQIRFSTAVADARVPASETGDGEGRVAEAQQRYHRVDPAELVEALEEEMRQAASDLDFERAARLRDQLFEVKAQMETAK
ncbi:MAG: UvrB/UvrC motif-containing protein, partial [Gemmatimonadales bacterium]